jgi:hypothetical protein
MRPYQDGGQPKHGYVTRRQQTSYLGLASPPACRAVPGEAARLVAVEEEGEERGEEREPGPRVAELPADSSAG